ncbi:general substrate transporter [Umbelopsis sp. PMI_123]|nr:general substrate transporter [Umbelopsis sp. PMI_123]
MTGMDSRQSGVRPYVYFCVVIAALGALNNGFNTSSLNIPGDSVKQCPGGPGVIEYYQGSSLPMCIPMSDWIWGVATGMFAIGGLIGALLADPMSSKWGRRDSMLMINTSFIIGAALLSTSTTSGQFAVGRIFVGIGSGFMTVVISMYIAEIAPPTHRGALGSFLQLFMTIGILVIEAIGLGLSSAVGWRIVVVFTIVPAIVQMVCLPFCTRSPRWLISQNRIEEARAALLHLRNGDIEEEFSEMVASAKKKQDTTSINDEKIIQGNDSAVVAHDKNGSTSDAEESDTPAFESEVALSVWDLMTIPVFLKLTLCMVVVHAGSQLSGINAVMYYSTTIFQIAFGNQAPYVTVGVGALNVVLTVVSLLLIDRVGRKILLLVSEFGMCVFCVIMCVSVVVGIPALQVVCIMLFVCCYAVGLGVIPFILVAEVFPTYAVGAASSVALVANWFFNFIIGLIYPTLQAAMGGYVFLIFAGIGLAHGIFTIFFIHETKGKSIETIGHELGWINVNPAVIQRRKLEKKMAKKSAH